MLIKYKPKKKPYISVRSANRYYLLGGLYKNTKSYQIVSFLGNYFFVKVPFTGFLPCFKSSKSTFLAASRGVS